MTTKKLMICAGLQHCIQAPRGNREPGERPTCMWGDGELRAITQKDNACRWKDPRDGKAYSYLLRDATDVEIASAKLRGLI